MKYDAIILTDAKTPYRVKPLGAYVIANSLRKSGYSCLVIDYFTEIEKNKLFSLLENFIGENTVFVGYSSSLLLGRDGKFQYLGVETDYFLEINQKIKSINSKTKIIFGGSYTNKFSEYCMENKNNLGVDYLIHGYSENMIVNFMKNYKEGKSQKFSKKNYGLYEINYDYKGSSFDFCDESFSWSNEDIIFERETLPLELSRGCIFKCKFCAYPLLGKNKNDLSYLKTEESILNEFLHNYEKYKTLNYLIIDDTFNERTDKLEILLRVRDRSKLDLSFVGYNRLDLIRRFPEQIGLFKDLNFKSHFFGIETFNYESSKIIGKGLKFEHATETLLKIKESMQEKVSISCGFILGLPKETIHTFSDWFLKIAKDDYPIDHINLNSLWISETTHTKSDFFNNPEKFGYSLYTKKMTDNYSIRMWKNQNWDQEVCQKIVDDFRYKLTTSGRNKVTGFHAIGYLSLGGELDDILNIRQKDVDYDLYDKKNLERIKKYVAKLEELARQKNYSGKPELGAWA